MNGWLHYGEPMHRLREFGATIKELDLIDEAALSSEQMRVVVSYLLASGNARDFPHPDEDWPSFVAAVSRAISEQAEIFDPILKKHTPWVNLKKLSSMYGQSSSGVCSVS